MTTSNTTTKVARMPIIFDRFESFELFGGSWVDAASAVGGVVSPS